MLINLTVETIFQYIPGSKKKKKKKVWGKLRFIEVYQFIFPSAIVKMTISQNLSDNSLSNMQIFAN